MKRITSLLVMLTIVVGIAFSQSIGQVTTGWTSEIPSAKLPVGATVPVVAALTSPQRANFSIDLDGTTIDNATETTAWTLLGNTVQDTIDANWIIPIYGIDTSLTITGRIVITDVLRRFDNFEPLDMREQYTAATNIFRVTGRFEWERD